MSILLTHSFGLFAGAPMSCSAPDKANSDCSFGSTGSGGAVVRRGSATSTSGNE